MFFRFNEVRQWYSATTTAVDLLEKLIDRDDQRLWGNPDLKEMKGSSPDEWAEYIELRRQEHEMFACLAALAVFEGMIRRDAIRRSKENSKWNYHQKFRKLMQDSHVSISKIIATWQTIRDCERLKSTFNDLSDLYRQRNTMAHGRAERDQYVFAIVCDKLEKIERKWKENNSYFRMSK
jgi:hypothetical protein